MGFFSGIANAVTNLFGISEQSRISKENLALQRENLDYQKQLQQTIFNREDNAVQRRAADLEAAGLSKTLAAGSAAGAGQAIQTEAPQRSDKYAQSMARFSSDIDMVGSVLNLMKQHADVSRTRAEANLLEAQAEHFSPIFGGSNSWFADVYRFLEQSGVDMSALGNNVGSIINKFLGLFSGNTSVPNLAEAVDRSASSVGQPYSTVEDKSLPKKLLNAVTYTPLDYVKYMNDRKISSYYGQDLFYGPFSKDEWLEKHDPDWVYGTDRDRFNLRRYGTRTRR